MKRRLASTWAAGIGMALLATIPAIAANEIIVPTQMPLSVALASAQNGDTITILPTGSPYQQFPGFAFSNKQLIIRGSTGNPGDVVLDGADLDIVMRISGAASAGSIIENLTIRNGLGQNVVNAAGAGIHLSAGASVVIRNCIIRDNVVPGANGMGAGIFGTASSVRVERCTFENNSVLSNIGDGGAIFFDGGAHNIVDCTFIGNGVPIGTAYVSGSYGGAVYARGGTAYITRCNFHANRSYFGGAVGVSGNMVMVIDQSLFADNAANNGGGFLIDGAAGGAAPRIRNSLFVANTGVNDAAIYTDKGGWFTNLTFAANAASGSYVIGGSTSSAIDNCVFWGNTYTPGNGLFPAHTPDVVRWCILQQAYAGAAGSGGNRVVDPLFVDAAARDFRLAEGSPAIDGADTTLYTGPFADLDGNQRGVDIAEVPDTGITITGPVIDAGAYEFQADPPIPDCPPDYNRDGILNSQDFFDFLAAFFTGC